MTAQKKAIIRINSEGEMTVEVSGVKGRSCKDATKFLEQLGQVTKSVPTSEMQEKSEVAWIRAKA
jgi:hypothetical protein